jgi:hypothetical protein
VAGVIDNGRQRPAIGRCGPRDEQHVVGGSGRIEAANELPRVLVPIVAVRGQRACSDSVGNHRRLETVNGGSYKLGDLLRQAVQIGSHQVAPGQIGAAGVHQSCPVRVRKGNQQLLGPDIGPGTDPLGNLHDLRMKEQTMVQGDHHLSLVLAVPLGSLKGHGGGQKGPMDSR